MKTNLLHSIAVSWANRLNHYAKREGNEFKKMTLGIEILLHNVPKLIIMIVLAYALGILHLTLITWIPFAIIRTFASGLHAKNSITCTITTLVMFVAIPYLIYDVGMNITILSVIMLVTCFGMYRYAPADTAARPILGKKKREKLKKQAVVSCVVIFITAWIAPLEYFYNLIALSYIYALIVILPLTYKVLNRSINNYEQYE